MKEVIDVFIKTELLKGSLQLIFLFIVVLISFVGGFFFWWPLLVYSYQYWMG